MKNAAIAILIAAAAHAQPTITQRQFRIEELKAPPGFEVTLYATGAGRPRLMAFGPNNVLYAASLEGSVIAIPQQGQVVTVARGLNPAQSVAFRGNDLYVSTNDGGDSDCHSRPRDDLRGNARGVDDRHSFGEGRARASRRGRNQDRSVRPRAR